MKKKLLSSITKDKLILKSVILLLVTITSAVICMHMDLPTSTAKWIDNTHWTITSAVAVFLSWLGASRNGPDLVGKRWFFYGSASFLVGQLLWDFLSYSELVTTFSIPDVFYLGLSVCFFIGIAKTCLAKLGRQEKYLLILDMSILVIPVLTGALMISLPYLQQVGLLNTLILTAYPLLFLTTACLTALCMLHLRAKPNLSWALIFLALLAEAFIWLRWNNQVLSNQLESLTWLNISFSILSPVLAYGGMRWRITPCQNTAYLNLTDRFFSAVPLLGVAISAIAIWLGLISQNNRAIDYIPLICAMLTVLLAFMRQNLHISIKTNVLDAGIKALESRNLLNMVFDVAPVRIFWKDKSSQFLGCNRSFAQDAGLDSPHDIVGLRDDDLVWHAHAARYRKDDAEVITSNQAKQFYEEPLIVSGNIQKWVRTTKIPIRTLKNEVTGVMGIYEDITDSKYIQQRERLKNRILELLTTEHSLQEILDSLALGVEENMPGSLCSIMLMNKDHTHLLATSGPSLSREYLDAINGIRVAHGLGSCGTAAYTGKRVIVEDIQQHPFWADFRDLAASENLHACWSQPIKSSDDEVLGTFGIYHTRPSKPDDSDLDWMESMATLVRVIIEKCQADEQAKLSEMVYQNSNEAMMVVDSENTIISINPAFSKLTGYNKEEILGKTPDMLKSGRHDLTFYKIMWDNLNAYGQWQGEIWNKHKDGHIFPALTSINSIYGEDGSVSMRIASYVDTSEKKRNEELIWLQANFDSLTGLPNRRMFNDRIQLEMKKAKREQSQFALLFLDLDFFKEVNDTLGHDMGDMLLQEAAKRLRKCIRETDMVARLGGDEFTAIISNFSDQSNLNRIANEILSQLSAPFTLGVETAYVSTSIGITLFPDDAEDASNLLKNADQAMYAAKNQGRNRLQYFTPAMQAAAQQRMRIANDLRNAISQQQLEVYYQPIVNLADQSIYKAEALLRWQAPGGVRISPAEFIPIAEETGLIVSIGEWVFQQALQQVNIWRDKYHDRFQISINKSPVQFRNADTSEHNWHEALLRSNLPGQAISVEITEGMLLDANESVIRHLLGFRDAGIQVSLDDFGTGYSSLSYLKKFDIDYLKIDRGFVQNIENDENDLVLCEAMIVMAHKLGIKVIAEGIETESQRDLLRSIGCDYGQGYLWTPPIPVPAFEAFMQQKTLSVSTNQAASRSA